MSHTDPQNDVRCTACPTEGPSSRLDEDGLCPDCRTPAGRLVAALAARGIKATANKRGIVRLEGATFVCEPGEASVPWVISDVAETLDGATESAADAIAAIVQAPGEAVSNVVAVGAGKSLRNVEAALRALAGGAS